MKYLSLFNEKYLETERQSHKEDAILLALRKDMALIRRDLEVYGMKKDGSTVFICKSDTYNNLWKDAYDSLYDRDGASES